MQRDGSSGEITPRERLLFVNCTMHRWHARRFQSVVTDLFRFISSHHIDMRLATQIPVARDQPSQVMLSFGFVPSVAKVGRRQEGQIEYDNVVA